MATISTHVLDTASGRPAPGIRVGLERGSESEGWTLLAEASTDEDGRIGRFGTDALEAGVHRLVFEVSSREGFYPEIIIAFRIDDPGQHYHVPLLLSPFGYTTYRGS